MELASPRTGLGGDPPLPGSALDPCPLPPAPFSPRLLFSPFCPKPLINSGVSGQKGPLPVIVPVGTLLKVTEQVRPVLGRGRQPKPPCSSQASRHTARCDSGVCGRGRRAPSSGRSLYAVFLGLGACGSLESLPPSRVISSDLNACFAGRTGGLCLSHSFGSEMGEMAEGTLFRTDS